MPSLDWIGKHNVINFHLKTPYCILERKSSYASDKELPSSAVQFKEPSTTWEAFTIGSFILLPVILIMVGIS